MATILSFTHSQPGMPFTQVPNFIEQASACERLASELAESHDTARNQVLSNQLYASLALLQEGLFDPIPGCLIDSFTVDALPAESPHFDADCTELCRYCMALSRVLGEQQTDMKTEHVLRDLLCGLTDYFVADMMAPRWVRGAQGTDEIRYA